MYQIRFWDDGMHPYPGFDDEIGTALRRGDHVATRSRYVELWHRTPGKEQCVAAWGEGERLDLNAPRLRFQ